MSESAERMRSMRQQFAAPGGRHDRLVRILRIVFPMIVGALAALLALAPFAMRSEISFVLDKDSVDIARERMRVDEALYRGDDSQGRPFSLRAGSAVQKSSREPVVDLTDLSARILLNEGPAQIRANTGTYNMKTERVRIDGTVQVESANGYRLSTRDVLVNLKERTMRSEKPVEGRTNIGTFAANELRADLGDRTITLEGDAKLRIVQGGLRGR